MDEPSAPLHAASMHRTLAPFAGADHAMLLVFCTNFAWRRSFLSAQQRTAAHSSAQLLWDTIEKTSAPCKILLGHNFGTETFVTRSVREMIDFLMSILSAPFCVHADKTSRDICTFGGECK